MNIVLTQFILDFYGTEKSSAHGQLTGYLFYAKFSTVLFDSHLYEVKLSQLKVG
jgi:hypothetical protein